MKKFIVLILLVCLVMMSTPAFAKGDGGFFTKWLDGMLGDSWNRGTTDTASAPAAKCPTCKPGKPCAKCSK